MDNLRLGLDKSSAIVCESCNNDTFTESVYLRRISKLLAGTPEDVVVPVPTFRCSSCGHVNQQFQIAQPAPVSKMQTP
jgi:uncharacterized Zn finger protein